MLQRETGWMDECERETGWRKECYRERPAGGRSITERYSLEEDCFIETGRREECYVGGDEFEGGLLQKKKKTGLREEF